MIEWGCRTDAGRVRANNEDSFGCAPELDLFVLSDGMGGLEFGQVASRLAVDTILAHCREARRDSSLPHLGDPMDGVSDTSAPLAGAIQLANQCIHQAAQGGAEKQQMGATVVVVQFVAGHMSFAHVGDSRIYRLRADRLEQLTQDHSFIAEQVRQGHMTDDQAFVSNLQNVLTRALGVDPTVLADVGEQALEEDDTILLCSDGLTRELSDTQIAGVLSEAEHAQEAADQLVTLANQAGGGDNITAVVLRPMPRPVGAFGPIGRLSKWFMSR
jgi:serine/threonine protein phosphatase PrpC